MIVQFDVLLGDWQLWNFKLLARMCSKGCCSYHECVCVCVCLSVCLSVKSHLTSGVSVHPKNTATYSVGDKGQNICGVFSEQESWHETGVKKLIC